MKKNILLTAAILALGLHTANCFRGAIHFNFPPSHKWNSYNKI